MKTQTPNKSKRRSGSPSAGELPKVISFRPNAEHLLALAEHAKAKKVTPHALAHSMVAQALRGKDSSEDIVAEVHKLQHQLFELREELALTTEVLLISAGKLQKEEAQVWVDANIKP